MTLTRNHQFGLSPQFAGLFESEELAALFAKLAAHEEIAPALAALEGKLLACQGLECVHDDDGPAARLAYASWVLNGQVFSAADLHCRLSNEARSLYLSWQVQAEVLPPAGTSIIQHRPAVCLTAQAAPEQPALEIARLRWHGDQARIDASWWPNVARIGADPRSLKMGQRALLSLPAGSLLRVYWQHSLPQLTWATLLPELIRICENQPEVAEKIAPALASHSEAELASAVLDALEKRQPVPPRLGDFDLIETIEPTAMVNARRGRLYQFAAANRPAGSVHLAVLADPAGRVGKARLRSSLGGFERPVQAEIMALIGTVPGNEPFELELERSDLQVAALYGPRN